MKVCWLCLSCRAAAIDCFERGTAHFPFVPKFNFVTKVIRSLVDIGTTVTAYQIASSNKSFLFCAADALHQVGTKSCLAARRGRRGAWSRDLSILMWCRELLLLATFSLMLLCILCALNNIGCMACTLVSVAVELLRVRVVDGWMRARTPSGPSKRLALWRNAVWPLKTNF